MYIQSTYQPHTAHTDTYTVQYSTYGTLECERIYAVHLHMLLCTFGAILLAIHGKYLLRPPQQWQPKQRNHSATTATAATAVTTTAFSLSHSVLKRT